MAKESGKIGFLGRVRSLLPKKDNRLNEWSPLPSGIIIGAFVGPVSLIFLIGATFDADSGFSPLYGLMSFVTGLIVVWAVSDGSYIAGMRRIANQDLQKDFHDEHPNHAALLDYVTQNELRKFDDTRMHEQARKHEEEARKTAEEETDSSNG